MIEAIPTNWKGYSFRSRLEARWAVFFTSLGVNFQYEPECYKMLNGMLYTPDFWFPVIQCWGEVKPCDPSEEERIKARFLSSHSGKELIWLIGEPDFKPYPLVRFGNGPNDIYEDTITWDIESNGYYHSENRLYTGADEVSENGSSASYKKAIHAAKTERFWTPKGGR